MCVLNSTCITPHTTPAHTHTPIEPFLFVYLVYWIHSPCPCPCPTPPLFHQSSPSSSSSRQLVSESSHLPKSGPRLKFCPGCCLWHTDLALCLYPTGRTVTTEASMVFVCVCVCICVWGQQGPVRSCVLVNCGLQALALRR